MPKAKIADFGNFGSLFLSKKKHFYHSRATKIFFQKYKKYPNENRILIFFCCQTYRCCTCSKCQMQTLAPTDAAIILCLNSVIFISYTVTNSYPYKIKPSEVLSCGFYTGNHRVLEFQP